MFYPKGVLLKGGLYVGELARVKVVALDKTGTITRGEPEVTEIVTHGETEANASSRLVAVAAGIEKRSQHPLAKAAERAEGVGFVFEEKLRLGVAYFGRFRASRS